LVRGGSVGLEPSLGARQARHHRHLAVSTLRAEPPNGGQNISEHLTQKYGSTAEQQAQIRDTIRQRGAAAGFEFNPDGRGRIYNTFNAHRLLHWAGEEHPDQQPALKMALLQACHRDRQTMDDPAVLLKAVEVYERVIRELAGGDWRLLTLGGRSPTNKVGV
jgi:predicted DsbA family dithiol-disulfide isomerase